VVSSRSGTGASVAVRDLLWKHTDYVPAAPISVILCRRADPDPTGVPYQAAFAEVEADVETGTVRVLKLAIVNDAGTVLNAAGAEAQQIGGQPIGLGEVLS